MRLSKGWALHIGILLLIIGAALVMKIKLRELNCGLEPSLEDNPRVLLLGDSHVGWNIDPAFIEHSINIGQDSESINFSYYKLLRMLELYPSIKTVIYGLGYHQLYDFEGEAVYMLNRYDTILDDAFYREKLEMEGSNFHFAMRRAVNKYNLPVGVSNDIAVYLIHGIIFKGERLPWMGMFKSYYENIIDRDYYFKKTHHIHYFEGSRPRQISELRVKMLKRIAETCQSRGIKLLLVNTPVHQSYYDKIPPGTISFVDSLATSLEAPGISYLNYSRMAVADGLFYDYHHLNKQGSDIFSEIVAQASANGN